jgi:hypothetical protein
MLFLLGTLNRQGKVVPIKNIILGVCLAWVIPLSLGGIFLICFDNRFGIFELQVVDLWLGLFLIYGGITQLVYIIPLTAFFRKKNNPGLVRGLLIGALTVFLGNIIGIYVNNKLEDRARQGATKGDIKNLQSATPAFYENVKVVKIVNELKTSLPVGTTNQNVITYLDANKIEHGEYDRQNHSLAAIVRNIEESPVVTTHLKIFFIFDINGRLTDFTLKEVYTGL